MILLQSLISLLTAGAGVYVLTHVNTLARGLQDIYIRSAERQQKNKGWSAYLFLYNPETWRTPFALLMFRAMIIFLGILLIVIAFPIIFGPVNL